MTVAGEGRDPTREHCLELAERAGVKAREARNVFDRVARAVARWPGLAGEAGCSKSATAKIGKAVRPL